MSAAPDPAPPSTGAPATGPAVPADVQATFCATLVDEWERAGLRDAVVSPGSRSTPLALAIARASAIRIHVVLDERSASFVALGIARATRRPVIVLCTSGTAAAELHAAVAEADLDRVPLIVCTADRPAELHRIGAPQTLDQQRLFGVSTRWFGELGVPSSENEGAWRSFAARSVIESMHGTRGPGPVQLNLPFREPLVGDVRTLPAGRPTGAPWHEHVPAARSLDVSAVAMLAARLGGRRGVIVAGDGSGPADAVLTLASLLGWPVLADPRAACWGSGGPVVGVADALLRDAGTAARIQPEVALRLGAPPASKVINSWVAGIGDDVLLDPDGAWLDPARRAALHVSADTASVAAALAGMGVAATEPSWAVEWAAAAACTAGALAERLDADEALDGEATDPAVARAVVSALPPGSQLVVSSSMPVRDVEWFAAGRPRVDVHSNRGANGIDGVVSTVVGVALGSGRPTVGLLGDLAFLHDIGGLLSARATGASAVFVVVDNAGGAIFEFLGQATAVERPEFELLFGTPQPVDVAAVAGGFGVVVDEVKTVRSLLDSVRAHTSSGALAVVVIRTDRRATVEAHRLLHAAVAAALAGSTGSQG